MNINRIKTIFVNNKIFAFLVSIVAVCILIGFPFVYVNLNYEFSSEGGDGQYTGLVLGASVVNNYPSDVLKQRLDAAGNAYRAGDINKIILSGSNQDSYYNEPQVMQTYLQNSYLIQSQDLILDFAGLRTLDSCYRARNVFKAKNITIITQRFHLTRALFLCQQYGFDNINTIPANNSRKSVTVWGYIREVPASISAFYDVFTGKTSTYMGDGSEQVIE